MLKYCHTYFFICTVLITTIIGCKKPYTPPAIVAPGSYLVVEGLIDSGSDSTFVKLSRTKNLGDTVTVDGETGATVSVESGATSYRLVEIKKGVYASAGLNLDNTKKYRLKIKTSDNNEYESEDVEVKQTPPIDSIGFKPDGDVLRVNVSTHDPANKTIYYRWDYDEDWRFHVKYLSGYEAVGDRVILRVDAHQIYYCFGKEKSSRIVIGSSVKLAQDVISKNFVTSIPSTSAKISIRYAILIRQYALTKAAYNFYESLQKNTENLGSIFDALPSELTGNIHNITNPNEPVIGFVSAGTVTSKRIFIDKAQLPAAWETTYPVCTQDSTVGPDNINTYLVSKLMVPTTGVYDHGFLIGYFRSTYECADCRLQGSVKKPSFWK